MYENLNKKRENQSEIQRSIETEINRAKSIMMPELCKSLSSLIETGDELFERLNNHHDNKLSKEESIALLREYNEKLDAFDCINSYFKGILENLILLQANTKIVH